MKKLKLDEVEVESFATQEESDARGTVLARGVPYSDQGTCSCPRLCTAAETCPGTCWILETCEPGVCY